MGLLFCVANETEFVGACYLLTPAMRCSYMP
jgi:hypothetical protein